MSVAEDLKAARDIVAQGWHKGGLSDGHGNVCALGALNIACYGNVDAMPMDWGRRRAAQDELIRHLPAGTLGAIATYNDAESTTHEDIINLFNKTLADLGAL